MGDDEFLPVGEAAASLGVTPRRVHQLVARGQLDARGGRAGIEVSRAAVERRAASAARPGRPWSDRTVWAAAWLLDDRTPDWLNARTLRRLRQALPGEGAEGVRRRLGDLVAVSRWAASAGVLSAIAREPGAACRWDDGALTVCLPALRADGVPGRYGLAPGADLAVVAVTGFWPPGAVYVPSAVA